MCVCGGALSFNGETESQHGKGPPLRARSDSVLSTSDPHGLAFVVLMFFDLVLKCQLEGPAQTSRKLILRFRPLRSLNAASSFSPLFNLPSLPHPLKGPVLHFSMASSFHQSLPGHCLLLFLPTQVLLGKTRSSVGMTHV